MLGLKPAPTPLPNPPVFEIPFSRFSCEGCLLQLNHNTASILALEEGKEVGLEGENYSYK